MSKRIEFSLILQGDDGNVFKAFFTPIQGNVFHLRLYTNGEEKASYWPLSADQAVELAKSHIVDAMRQILAEHG